MPDRSNIVYTYDGTFEGLLSAVFEAYSRNEIPEKISTRECVQISFGQVVHDVETDDQKFERVKKGIVKKLGGLAFHKVLTCFLSCEDDKDTIIYDYLRLGFKIGRKIDDYLVDDTVQKIEKMYYYIGGEKHSFLGFIRFSALKEGAYFAKIKPKNNIIPIIMDHFADRFNTQPFIIFDEVHNIAGVYDCKSWYMISADDLNMPSLESDELRYRELWKTFYDTIAIESRVSHKRRRTMMPMRYWSNMTELKK